MDNARGRIERHIGTFTYAHKTISFAYWSHLQNNEIPDTITFLGTGQTGRIAKWVATAAPGGVVVVEGAPHWHAHPSGKDLYDFMYAYTRAAVQVILTTFSLTSIHLIAQSQAAPGVVMLGNDCPDQVRNIVLVAPLGFAATIFGDTPKRRMHTLIRRAGRSVLQLSQSPFHDPRNVYIGLMLLRAVLLESERGASKRKYGIGLSYDMREDCRLLVERQAKKGKTVTLLLGGKDKVFTVNEILPLIEATGIKDILVTVLPESSHSSLAVRGAKKALQTAVAMVRV